MFKLDLEKAEEPEIKLPTLMDHRESKRVPEEYLLPFYAKTFNSVDHNKLWKILQGMGIPDHFTCLLRSLYEDQEATRHATTEWFQIVKGVHQGCVLLPWLFNLYAEYIMGNARLAEAQAGIKTARRNINNFRYADDTTFMTENEEKLKSL